MEEENKMNKRTSIIIGVIVLLVLVLGAAYAYFAVGTSNLFGTTTISATAEDVGTVTLNNINSTLSMDLTAADMMRKNVGYVICDSNPRSTCTGNYATLAECNEYVTNGYHCALAADSADYYATPTGKSTDIDDEIHEIARATLTPSTDANYYSCDYTLSISHTGTNDMYDRFNTNYTNKSVGQLRLIIDGTEYDWYDGFPSTHSGNLIVSANTPASIYAGMAFINEANIDQTHLAGTDIAITIQATSFSCTALETEIEYFNAINENSPLHLPGNMPYYIKRTLANSTPVDMEICAVIGSTTVCMPYYAGEDVQSYVTELTNAGATCTFVKADYSCTYGNITLSFSDGGGDVEIGNSEGNCSINSNGYECHQSTPAEPEPGNGSK